MIRLVRVGLFLFLISLTASAQVMSIPSSGFGNIGSSSLGISSGAVGLGLLSSEMMTNNLFLLKSQNHSPLDTPNGSLSKLDLKAPGKARHEYEKGYQLLMKRDFQGAVQHLTIATSIYPNFVSAHNSLGTAYLSLNQNDQARAEFAQAVALDDHLPTSFFNLGCAELALKHYLAAEESIQKATTIAPLDLPLLTALAYGQYMNQHFSAVVTTAQKVHERKHEGSSMVHFYAAAAWEAQGKFSEAQSELDTLLKEDPKSPAADQARQLMLTLKEEATQPAASASGLKISFTQVPAEAPSGPVQIPERVRKLMQESKENAQIAEAEADAGCPKCPPDAATPPLSNGDPSATSYPASPSRTYAGPVYRSSADEVAIFFSATNHGKSVTSLTGSDVGIRDNSKAPAAITGFRNESALPLRLGLVIDSSDSISSRFKFEQGAASSFLSNVVTGPNDLAFVVGFSNSVLLVQDFTKDQTLVSQAVGKLVASGGTALWDAVDFAAEKLASRVEDQPVARILVIISDGDDNSSTVTAKQAITRAQRGEVTIYTVSTRDATVTTRDVTETDISSSVGEHALRTLADLTGGAAFVPGSVHRLKGSFSDLQQVIRSRYLISYKPALFQRDGKYRAIDITAEKDGHKLHVYARKGYFASTSAPNPDHF
jgi:Ca-activated chloride channel family protein